MGRGSDLGAPEDFNYPRQTSKFGLELQFADPRQHPVTLVCKVEYKIIFEIDPFCNALMV